MHVLVTGCHGYIGSVLVPILLDAGHHVLGLDSGLFKECLCGPAPQEIEYLAKDIRDVTVDDLVGMDAVIHLAALSNDPMGNLNSELTYEINHRASVRLAERSKEAGVKRFLFSSSCSSYGAMGDKLLTEASDQNPVTPYGETKVFTDRDVSLLANDQFSPIFLRNATAYGFSPRLRLDLVVNDFVATALTTGSIILKSDGLAWRPLVHVEDISRAFLAILEAPREAIHNEAFNIGRTDENFQIREVALMVQEALGDCDVEFATTASTDLRCYKVSCEKIAQRVPQFQPKWNVITGARDLAKKLRQHGFQLDDLKGDRYFRLPRLNQQLETGEIRPDLRPISHRNAAILSVSN